MFFFRLKRPYSLLQTYIWYVISNRHFNWQNIRNMNGSFNVLYVRHWNWFLHNMIHLTENARKKNQTLIDFYTKIKRSMQMTNLNGFFNDTIDRNLNDFLNFNRFTWDSVWHKFLNNRWWMFNMFLDNIIDGHLFNN